VVSGWWLVVGGWWLVRVSEFYIGSIYTGKHSEHGTLNSEHGTTLNIEP